MYKRGVIIWFEGVNNSNGILASSTDNNYFKDYYYMQNYVVVWLWRSQTLQKREYITGKCLQLLYFLHKTLMCRLGCQYLIFSPIYKNIERQKTSNVKKTSNVFLLFTFRFSQFLLPKSYFPGTTNTYLFTTN